MINPVFIVPLSGMTPLSEISGKVDSARPGELLSQQGQHTFAETLRQKIQEVKNIEQASLDSAYAVATGQSEDIEGAMIDATRASIAIETTVQITTRAVNAYKEIMQMQI